MHVQQMRTLLNDRDQKEVLDRLTKVRPDSQRRWGSMSAHQIICHLNDSFRAALSEKHVSSSSTLFERSTSGRLCGCPSGGRTASRHALKWISSKAALGPLNSHLMLRTFAFLFERFCGWKREFAPHAMFGQLSRTERMRHTYLNMDHHLRQFGA
jgi:hypothetical protein